MSEAKKKVLHILTAFDYGGVETQMLIIQNNLHHSEFRHLFCAIAGGGNTLDAIVAAGGEATALNKSPKIPSIQAAIALIKLIREYSPEVVHLHGVEANFHGAIAAWLARVNVVIAEEIGIPSHSKLARIIFNLIYRLCDRVIAVSSVVKDYICRIGEARPESVEVIFNPFVPRDFHPPPAIEDEIKLCYVGRLENVKNPMAAIDACRALNDLGSPASLRLIGDGSLAPTLHAKVHELSLESKVHFLGFQSSPFDHLKGCNFYIQPSFTEGFSIALCEAMSSGIPVISTKTGAAPEIINHGVNGWLLDAPTAHEIVKVTLDAAKLSHSQLVDISVAARARVVDEFAAAAYMRNCDRLYQNLLGT